MNTQQFNHLVQKHAQPCSDFDTGFHLKHWSVEKGHNVMYLNNDFHTLSFYLKGGNMNTRIDQPALKGTTSRFCFMSQSQESVWQIKNPTEFAHIYFSQALIKRFAASTYQIDTRRIELTDQTFLEDAQLQALFLRLFKAKQLPSADNNLIYEQLSFEVLDHVVRHFNGFDIKRSEIKGGLSPMHQKHTLQKIMDDIGNKLSIASLAKETNLSPYHFAKMFKLSFGEPPASFINWLRIEKAKSLLKSTTSLSDISLQLGFSHQSHLTQSFKRMTGITPARYRAIVTK